MITLALAKEKRKGNTKAVSSHRIFTCFSGCVPGDAHHIKHMAMVPHVFIYPSTEPASAEPTMYYGCDELQVYRGGENSLIFAIIFALLGLTVQSHMGVITHDVLLSMTLGRSPGVGNATAVFLPGKFHGQMNLDLRRRDSRRALGLAAGAGVGAGRGSI